MNQIQVAESTARLGEPTVDMLLRTHQDAIWMLENLGVGCKHPGLVEAFGKYEAQGEAYIYEGRIYVMSGLVEKCLKTVPPADEFFVPKNSLFVGGQAPYVYDEVNHCGGLMPTPAHVEEMARIADTNDIVAGLGPGIQLKSESRQIEIMDQNCSKPLYFSVSTDEALAKAREVWNRRQNVMAGFCLTRPPLEVNDNLAGYFIQVAMAGMPLCIVSMPLAGVTAPYCYNGILAFAHAEVLFGICAAQIINPGVSCVHGGFPAIADPRNAYTPNYGLISHQALNLLLSHLNMMLDLPTNQSAGTTNEPHPNEKAYEETRRGLALCGKYGFHMIRHPFGFLKLLVDFSLEKMKRCIEIAEEVKADEAPEVEMPAYDERGMESIQNIGLGMYLNDPLTTANISKVFVD